MLPITSSRLVSRWFEDADENAPGSEAMPPHAVPPMHASTAPLPVLEPPKTVEAKPEKTVHKEVLSLKKDADFVALQKRIIALESEAVSLRQGLTTHHQEFASVRTDLSSLEGRLTSLGAELDSFRQETQSSLQSLRSDHEALRAAHGALRFEYDAHLADRSIHNAGKFHYVETKQFFPIGFNPAPQLYNTLDVIFRNRADFNPRVAAWLYTSDYSDDDDEHMYFIVKVVMATQEPVSTLVMMQSLKHEKYELTYKSLHYMNFRKYFYDGQSRFHRSHKGAQEESTYGGLEYWYYVALVNADSNTFLNPTQSRTQFTKSDNYKRSPQVQQFLEDRIYEDNDLDDLTGEQL